MGWGWRADSLHEKGKIGFKSLLKTRFGRLRLKISTFGKRVTDGYITTNMSLGGPRLGPMANTNHTHILSASTKKHWLLLSDFFFFFCDT